MQMNLISMQFQNLEKQWYLNSDQHFRSLSKVKNREV